MMMTSICYVALCVLNSFVTLNTVGIFIRPSCYISILLPSMHEGERVYIWNRCNPRRKECDTKRLVCLRDF